MFYPDLRVPHLRTKHFSFQVFVPKSLKNYILPQFQQTSFAHHLQPCRDNTSETRERKRKQVGVRHLLVVFGAQRVRTQLSSSREPTEPDYVREKLCISTMYYFWRGPCWEQLLRGTGSCHPQSLSAAAGQLGKPCSSPQRCRCRGRVVRSSTTSSSQKIQHMLTRKWLSCV